MDRRPHVDINGGEQPSNTAEELQSLIDGDADWFLNQSDIEQVAVGRDSADRPYLHVGTSGDAKEVERRVFERLQVRPIVTPIPPARAYGGPGPVS